LTSCNDDDDDFGIDLPKIQKDEIIVVNASEYPLYGLNVIRDFGDSERPPKKIMIDLAPGEYYIFSKIGVENYYFSIKGTKVSRYYFSKTYSVKNNKCILTSNVVGNWKTEGTYVYYFKDEFNN